MTRRAWQSEYFGLSREQAVDLYEGLLRLGWIDSPEIEGPFFSELLTEFGVNSAPKSGWPHLAYELRLVECTLPSLPKANTKGRADLAKKCIELAEKSGRVFSEIAELTLHADILIVQREPECKLGDDFLAVRRLQTKLERIAAQLKSERQPPKWRQSQLHNIRIGLASNLAGIFESEFNQAAKPVGGSASLQIEHTNDWTRFFQAIASVFMKEKVTPDRQNVLWKAAAPTE